MIRCFISEHIVRGGGAHGSKFKFLLVLNYLKIWNPGVQELFPEFEKLLVRKNDDVANSACFAKDKIR